jgi:hypothetical protein
VAVLVETPVSWIGPYSRPAFGEANGLPELPNFAGVYLWTIEYTGGHLIYAAGITGDLRKIFKQHTAKYLAGGYTVFDITEMKSGRNLARSRMGWLAMDRAARAAG